MSHWRSFTFFKVIALAGVTILLPAAATAQRAYKEDASDWKIAIFPVYGWAPVLGASMNVPTLPDNGGSNSDVHPGAKVSGSFDMERPVNTFYARLTDKCDLWLLGNERPQEPEMVKIDAGDRSRGKCDG